MSSGVGYTGVGDILPTYDYHPVQMPQVAMPDLSLGHAADAAQQAAGHAVDHAVRVLAHVGHELVAPAVTVLSALSGVMLVGRAAMYTTQVLARVAVRAADDQRCLERQQENDRTAAEQWESAAFAAARANARRTLLEARITRAVRSTPPGWPPPPAPVLPPPVQPTGSRLDATRIAAADLEQAVRDAEAEFSEWTCAVAVATAADPADDAWQFALREKRAAARARQDAESDSTPTTAPRTGGVTREEVVTAAAELLGDLPRAATVEDTEPVVTALQHALTAAADGLGAMAGDHLREARIFARDTGRRVRVRAAALEEAAGQLEFLTAPIPEDVEPQPPAQEVVALLRRAVQTGRPLTQADCKRVREAMDRRWMHLEHRYVQRVTADLPQLLADLTGGSADRFTTEDGHDAFDWAPPDWQPDHWLRVTAHGEAVELTTMRRGPAGPLDTKRCGQAQEWADELAVVAAKIGLVCDFRFAADRVVQGEPAGDALARELRTAHGPSARQHEETDQNAQNRDIRRPDEGPRYRRIDGAG